MLESLKTGGHERTRDTRKRDTRHPRKRPSTLSPSPSCLDIPLSAMLRTPSLQISLDAVHDLVLEKSLSESASINNGQNTPAMCRVATSPSSKFKAQALGVAVLSLKDSASSSPSVSASPTTRISRPRFRRSTSEVNDQIRGFSANRRQRRKS
eukprot:899079-Rhodomonas_salina.1